MTAPPVRHRVLVDPVELIERTHRAAVIESALLGSDCWRQAGEGPRRHAARTLAFLAWAHRTGWLTEDDTEGVE